MTISLSTLLTGLGLKALVAGEASVKGISIDPDEVGEGVLFIARQGWYYDTHTRLAEVIQRGAAGLVVSRADMVPAGCKLPCYATDREDPLLAQISARFYKDPTKHLRVFGVTGTNGKTTTAHLLAHALRSAGEKTALIGTVGYDVGDGIIQKAPNTTPDAIIIQRLAREALDAGAKALVMEVSSHALDIGRVAGVWFDVVGFTNLTHDHLDFHKTLEAYAGAKRRLFGALLDASEAAGKRPGAVVSVDGTWGDWMLEATSGGVKRLTVGVKEREGGKRGWKVPHWTGHIAAHDINGLQGEVRSTLGEVWPVKVALVGQYNMENLLVALGMVSLAFPGEEKIQAAFQSLETFPGVPGRLQRAFEPIGGEPAVFVDHAHTPDAVGNVLRMMKEIQPKPVTAVLGCGGDRDPTKRAPMARVACDLADQVILTSDNPRSEDPEVILDAMMSAIPAQAASTQRITDRERAVEAALRSAKGPVLLLGKGHEDYQEIKGIKHPYSDLQCAQSVIARLRVERRWRLPLRREAAGSTAESESFKQVDITKTLEIPVLPHPGAFAAQRKHHRHEGVDLYATSGEAVFAVEAGVVVGVEHFTGPSAGSPWWLDTQAVLVEGAVGVVCYGEIIAAVQVGQKIVAGQRIGHITPVLRKDKGRPRSMLHLELYTHGARQTLAWEQGPQPPTLCDPTAWLLDATR